MPTTIIEIKALLASDGTPKVDSFSKPFLRSVKKFIGSGERVKKDTFIFEKSSNLSLLLRTSGQAVFYLYARIRIRGKYRSKIYKRKICEFCQMEDQGISSVRDEARELYRAISRGHDPKILHQKQVVEDQRAAEIKASIKTLREMTSLFLENGKNGVPYSASYQKDILYHQKRIFSDWQDLPFSSITGDMVVERCAEKPQGRCDSSKAFRELRSMYNFARRRYKKQGIYRQNPVEELEEWYESKPRKVRLHQRQLKPYLSAVLEYGQNYGRVNHLNSVYRNARDGVIISVFTGLRRTEVLSLSIDKIDLSLNAFSIRSKNGDDYLIPMNSAVASIILGRINMLKRIGAERGITYKFLFPGVGARKESHYLDTRTFRSHITDKTGIHVTNHDYRRTFKSIGAELGINSYMLNDLVGHERNIRDVNTSYLVFDIDILRAESQKVCDHILERCGDSISSQLVSLYPH